MRENRTCAVGDHGGRAAPVVNPANLSGQAAAVLSVLRGVAMLAEQAPQLSDEQLRTRLAALGGLVR